MTKDNGQTGNDDIRIVRYEATTRRSLRHNRPTSGGNVAIVYKGPHGELIHATRRLTAGEIWFKTPAGMYTVDTSMHNTILKLALPSEEKAFHFTTDLDVSWHVFNPIEAINDNLTDGDRVVREFLERKLRELSRTFNVEQSAEAERAINRTLDGGQQLAHGVALLRCHAKVSLDESTRRHIAQRTLDKREAERRKASSEAALLDRRLSLQENAAQHALDRQAAEHARAIESMQEQHRIDLEKQRMKHYIDILDGGDTHVLALRLSSNRDDVNEVIRMLMQQRQLDFDSARGMLQALLEQGLANRRDVADIMARATAVVANHISHGAITSGGNDAQGHDPQQLPRSGLHENHSDDEDHADTDDDV